MCFTILSSCENIFNILFATFILPACPSAPKDFKVAEVTRHHVHLMWETPEHDGGSPVTHYQIEKREVSRKTWAKVHLSVYLCGAEVVIQFEAT